MQQTPSKNEIDQLLKYNMEVNERSGQFIDAYYNKDTDKDKTYEQIRNQIPLKEAHPDYEDKELDALLQNTDPNDPEEPSWVKKARYNRDNRQMLHMSARLAILILSSLKELNMTKQELATALNKTYEEVDSYVHGEHNFDLKTVCDLERALGKQLIKINIDF